MHKKRGLNIEYSSYLIVLVLVLTFILSYLFFSLTSNQETLKKTDNLGELNSITGQDNFVSNDFLSDKEDNLDYNCQDSDNGKYYSVKGEVKPIIDSWKTNKDSCVFLSQSGQLSFIEKCTGDNCFIREFYCSSNNKISIDFKNCNSNCFEGECKNIEDKENIFSSCNSSSDCGIDGFLKEEVPYCLSNNVYQKYASYVCVKNPKEKNGFCKKYLRNDIIRFCDKSKTCLNGVCI